MTALWSHSGARSFLVLDSLSHWEWHCNNHSLWKISKFITFLCDQVWQCYACSMHVILCKITVICCLWMPPIGYCFLKWSWCKTGRQRAGAVKFLCAYFDLCKVTSNNVVLRTVSSIASRSQVLSIWFPKSQSWSERLIYATATQRLPFCRNATL